MRIKTTLHEVCIADGLRTGPFGSQLKAEEYSETGIPVVMPRDIVDGRVRTEQIAKIPEKRALPLKKHLLRVGDIIFSRRGDLSKVAVISEKEEGFLCGTGCLRARPKPDINPEYLRYLAVSEEVVGWLQKHAVGQTMPNLNTNILSNLPFFVPSRPVQDEIVRILSQWDCSIAVTESLIAGTLDRRAWLMQQLLSGKRRLPLFRENWTRFRIGEFLTESRVSGSHGQVARKISVKLYGQGVVPKVEPRVGSENTKYYIRKKGQFIYSKLDFLNGAFGLIPDHLDGYESTLDLPCFDIHGAIEPKFLLHLVSRESFYSRFLGSAMGGRKARRVSPAEFLAIEIAVPGIEEQKAIVKVIDTAGREIELLRQQVNALRQQKKGLMQQLLTGKVRVKVPPQGD